MLGYDDQAEVLKFKAMQSSSKSMGSDHPFTLHALASLAATY
jgi:hypothetical protein